MDQSSSSLKGTDLRQQQQQLHQTVDEVASIITGPKSKDTPLRESESPPRGLLRPQAQRTTRKRPSPEGPSSRSFKTSPQESSKDQNDLDQYKDFFFLLTPQQAGFSQRIDPVPSSTGDADQEAQHHRFAVLPSPQPDVFCEVDTVPVSLPPPLRLEESTFSTGQGSTSTTASSSSSSSSSANGARSDDEEEGEDDDYEEELAALYVANRLPRLPPRPKKLRSSLPPPTQLFGGF